MLITRSRDDTIGTYAHLAGSFAAWAAVLKEQPSWGLFANLTRRQSFVFAVIPLHQIVIDLRRSAGKLARDLGLDDSTLRAALENKQFEPNVIADEREAAELGVHAVPAFVFNRRFALTGVQPTAALEEMVNRASEFDRVDQER